MHIPPKDAWDMSYKEVTLAIKGFREYNGGKQTSPMTEEKLEKLKQLSPDY